MYTPPNGSYVELEFESYTPPSGEYVELDLGVLPIGIFALIESDSPFSLLGIPEPIVVVESYRKLNISSSGPFNPLPSIRIRDPDMDPLEAAIESKSPLGELRGMVQVTLLKEIFKFNLFPFKIQVPIREYLEWSNSLFTNRKGSEYAIRHFTRPRRMIDYSLYIAPELRTQVLGTLINAKGKFWKFPDWREMERVSISSGATQISTEANYPFDGELIIWKSPNNWEIISYYKFNSILYLDNPVSEDKFDSILMPITEGRIDGEPLLHSIETGTRFELTFELLNNPVQVLDYDEEVFPTFKDVEVFEQCPVYTGTTGIEGSVEQLEEKFDPGTGLKSIVPIWDCPKHSTSFLTLQENREELNSLLRFLYRRYGRYSSFYMPSWNRDYLPYDDGFIENVVTVENTGYNSCIQNIAIRKRNGEWLYREIQEVTVDGPFLKIEVDSLNIEFNEVERISHLREYTLSSNRIEIRHLRDLQSDCRLSIVEIDRYDL